MNYKLRRFFKNFAIENLMSYIAASMALVFVGDLLLTASNVSLSSYLVFNKAAILNGEIWRVITFLFIPQTNNVIFIVFSVYFYYMVGKSVENAWGSHDLTMYFLTGYAMLLVIGFTTGYVSAQALYFSLFLVYASFYPNHQFNIYFLIPIEAKWLAVVDAVIMMWDFFKAFSVYPLAFTLALGMQLSVLAAFAVYGIFFGKPFIERFINRRKHKEFFHEMRRHNIKVTKHDEEDDDQ